MLDVIIVMCNAHQLHIPFKQTTKEAEMIYFTHFFFVRKNWPTGRRYLNV